MFGIDNYDKFVFNHNFLRNIIFKVHYKENKSCSAQRQKFIDAFKENYPIHTDGISQEISLTMGTQQTNQAISIKDNGDAHQVIMRSTDAQREFVLTNDFLQYKENGKTYKSSTDFNSQIKKALGFLKFSDTNECKSLTLRKINIIDFTSDSANEIEVQTYEALSQLLAPHLLCQYNGFLSCNKFIKQNIYNLQLEENGYTLTIKYGYIIAEINPTITSAKGQIIIDLFLEKSNITAIDSLDEEIEKCHQELYNAFRWSISDRMLEILKQQS